MPITLARAAKHLALAVTIAQAAVCWPLDAAAAPRFHNRVSHAVGVLQDTAPGTSSAKLPEISADACSFRDGALTLKDDGSGEIRGRWVLAANAAAHAANLNASIVDERKSTLFRLVAIAGPPMAVSATESSFPFDVHFSFDRSQFSNGGKVDLALSCRALPASPPAAAPFATAAPTQREP